MASHNVTSTHPPTLTHVIADLWLPRDAVHHGLAGQIGAAAAGLVQLLILAACWGTAHALASSKTRAAITALLLIASLATCAAANNT